MSQTDLELQTLSRCSICPNTNRCVSGDGPTDARIMCVGEEPGREEDSGGRPFIGAAGREFNLNYLPLAGLHRSLYDITDSDVFVTNARKCRIGKNKTPTYKEMIGCANHFVPHELRVVNPAVVVLMGSVPCKLLGERGVDLESEHGIPRHGEIYGWTGWIVPMYHPAAGLHDGSMMQPMLEDWQALGEWLRTGEWQWARETIEHRDYRLCRTVNEVDQYFLKYKTNGKSFREVLGLFPLVGLDTETHAGVRWSIQVSIKPGTGMMIQTDTGKFDGRLLHALRYWIEPYEWALHNAEADLWVRDLLDLPNQPYRDTMQEAYQFQNLPQKLKALSRRILGRQRLSWAELVGSYSRDKLHEWMRDGILYAEANWRTVTERVHKKSGKALKPDIRRSKAESLLLDINSHMVDNPDYPVWDKIDERLGELVLGMVVAAVGQVPQLGIAHVPLQEAVVYGCSDADDTLALALEFDRMRREFKDRLGVTEEDRDIRDTRAVRV